MNTKHQVHNLIILDESGSMNSIKETIISGFNELVETVKGIAQKYPEQEHFISMVSFNSLDFKELHLMDPVNKLHRINSDSYEPSATTPLYDAMGSSITKLDHSLKEIKNKDVLVTLLTDGMENASKEYSHEAIKRLVGEKKKAGWTFTYIGTDHDIEQVSYSLSIDNYISFDKTHEGTNSMFLKERIAREEYSRKIRFNEKRDKGFYDENS
jgi:hypothetical protein